MLNGLDLEQSDLIFGAAEHSCFCSGKNNDKLAKNNNAKDRMW